MSKQMLGYSWEKDFHARRIVVLSLFLFQRKGYTLGNDCVIGLENLRELKKKKRKHSLGRNMHYTTF